MKYKIKWNKFFEIIIIFFTLIIILLQQSDITIKERSPFLNNYSQNYFYFIISYLFFFGLFFLKKIRNFSRLVLMALMLLMLYKSFKNEETEYYFLNQLFAEIILFFIVTLFSLNFISKNFFYIKFFNPKKIIINFLELNIRLIIKFLSLLFILILIIEIILHFMLPKNYTNIIPSKIYGNYFFNFPYRHQALPLIEMGMAGNVNLTYKHKTKAGKEYEIKYNTNNNGFRIPFDFSISDKYEKKDNELVILLIGGSTALGVGSSDEGTITKLLELKLENKLPNYEFTVLNLGIGAANTYQEYLVLDLYGKNFNPDWVISLTGRNDGYNSLHSNMGTGYPNGYIYKKNLIDGLYYNQPYPKVFYSNFSNFLAKHSFIYRILTGSTHLEETKKNNIKFEETFKTLNFYLKSISNIINSDKSINYIISNQPFLNTIINKSGKEFYMKENLEKFEIENFNKSYLNINKSQWMEYWNAKISYETELFLKNKNKVFYLNFNKEFSNIENINNIFIDSTHLTREGNNLIAEKYYQIILQ